MSTGNHNEEAGTSRCKSVEEQARENNTAFWDFYKEPVRDDVDEGDEEMGDDAGDEGNNGGDDTTNSGAGDGN